jgi:hypothetical protein
MATIRLFGRGKSATAEGAGETGAAVDAETIAKALAQLSTAAVSATWRCRHGSGMSIGEGAVDFAGHRSRATVIRGKHTYEYVRNGSKVYRAIMPGQDETLAVLAPEQSDQAIELEEQEAQAADLEAADLEVGEGEHDADFEPQAGADEDQETDETHGDDQHDDWDQDEQPQAAHPGEQCDPEQSGQAADDLKPADQAEEGDQRPWQSFSEHDVCGPHSYAEPAVLAQAVRRAGIVQPRKAEQFDGVELSAFCVTAKPKPADPDKLLARLARQLRDHGANTLVVTAFVDQSPAAESDDAASENGQSTSGGAPRIVRLRIELPHWTPADDPTADHAVSIELFELGDPVQIDLPDPRSATRRTSRTCADLSLF